MPHKIVKTFEHAGLTCVVVEICRNVPASLLSLECPPDHHFCGYVGVPDTHPLFGRDYSEMYGVIDSVHGGLTFSGTGEYPLPDSPLWFFGFDCAHCGDSPEVQDAEYTEHECCKLAKTLKECE